jgi:hypothetical protein
MDEHPHRRSTVDGDTPAAPARRRWRLVTGGPGAGRPGPGALLVTVLALRRTEHVR